MMSAKRIPWSEAEDRICCQHFLKEYVLLKKDTDIENLLDDIKECENFIKRDRSSIRMRLQNIKAVLEELHIPNTAKIRPLTNASGQTRKILVEEWQRMSAENK